MPLFSSPSLAHIRNAGTSLLYPPLPTKSAGFTDNVTISNPSLTRLNNFKVRVLPVQSLVITDSHVRMTTRLRLLLPTPHNLTLVETINRLKHRNKSLTTHNISLVDSGFSRIRNKQRSLSQSLSLSESFQSLRHKLRLLSTHIISLTHSQQAYANLRRSFSQGLTLSHSHLRSLSRIKTFTENLTFTSNTARIRARLKAISGAPVTLNFDENVASLRSIIRVLSQALGLTDSSITRFRGLVNRYFTENLGPLILDSINTTLSYVRGFEESLSLIAEDMTQAVPVRIRALANQALQFIHINTRVTNRIKSTSTQNVNITDSPQYLRHKLKYFEQTLAFSSNVQYARAILTRGFTAVIGLGSSVVYRIPNKVRLISNVLNLTSSVVKDIPSRVVEIPLISTIEEKITRPELYASVNPIALYRRIVERDSHPLIKRKDLDSLNLPVKKPDIPVSIPELKAHKPEEKETDLKTKINRGRKIGRLF